MRSADRKKREKALYRIEQADGTARWIHYSRRDSTVILRWLPTDEARAWKEDKYRLPVDQRRLTAACGTRKFSLTEIAARTVDAVDVSADELAITQIEAWRRIFSRLDEPRVLDRALAYERSEERR